MQYNFDQVVNRKNTDCLKFDFAVERGYPQDVLPLWVADMDFRTPQPVIDVLKERAEHGIFGYTDTKEDYYQVVASWFAKHFGWQTEEKWLVKTPGIVYAIAAAVRAFTKEGDAVMLQNPVYYPFTSVIKENNRKLVNNALRYQNGYYSMDFEDMERKIVQEQVKLLILCSPHNPVGRVWTREELQTLGEICQKHQVLVVSDEIHCDFTFEGHTHTIFANISKEFADFSIICTAASKTFNLAGLQASNIFIANEKLRRKYKYEISASGYSQLNAMGLAAVKAAYTYGQEWVEQLRSYLAGNLSFMREFLEKEMPEVKLVEPQGTYLTWVDCSGLRLSDKELNERIIQKARLWLDAGNIFGKEGDCFERFNIACPRSVLEEAMNRFAKIVY